MKILRHARPATDTAIAIGSFDGVHLGHQAMLERVKAVARERGLASAALTFEPLPREFFASGASISSGNGVGADDKSPLNAGGRKAGTVLEPREAPARLASLGEKLAAIERAGVDIAFVERFGRRFAAIGADAFAERLARHYRARWLLVGEDFRYGAGRKGDAASLAAAGRALGFEVEILPSVAVEGERVSSTRVRDALAAGDFDRAASLLGRPYAITGRVVHGRKRGRGMGFPTANIRLARPRAALHGIYAVKCFGAATRGLEGVASLGMNPAVADGGPATLEAFLFDFSGDLYGRRLTIEFVKKLRDEAHFASLDELAAQIRRDCEAARAFFRGA